MYVMSVYIIYNMTITLITTLQSIKATPRDDTKTAAFLMVILDLDRA